MYSLYKRVAIYEWLAILILVSGCTKKRPIPHVVNVTVHKIDQSPIQLPERILYTSKGKSFVKKPSIWNRRTLSFSEGMPQTYIVKKGDNLYNISKANYVPLAAIIGHNNVSKPYRIYPGQPLTLLSPKVHLVAEEDDIYKIATLHKVSVSTLVATNKLKDPHHLKKGQPLILPASPAPEQKIVPLKMQTVSNYIRPQTTPSHFLRPIEGKVISSYGPQGKGLYNDGVNIEAPLGAPVHTAEEGTVVYTGKGMRSYGNLVLVRHGGGWLTAYAHLQDIHVTKGQLLKKGQVLATVGKTGVKTPQLHFELRNGTKPVDPMLHLG